jgi:hypothetical protein
MKNLICLVLVCTGFVSYSQPISGVWRGKITNGKGLSAASCRLELKLVKNGDSLLGTAYYYLNSGNFIRYSVKGYFDPVQNTVHWQDQQVLAIKPEGKGGIAQFKESMIANADFNCPGNNIAMLDGTSQIGLNGPQFNLHFDKVTKTFFPDEWDNVIEGYFTGMDNPEIIDSVYAIAQPYVPPAFIAKNKPKKEPAASVAVNDGNTPPPAATNAVVKEDAPVTKTDSVLTAKAEPVKPLPVEPLVKAKADTVAVVARQEVPKPVEPKAIAKPDTVTVVARQEVPKPVEPKVTAKTDTVAVVARQEVPKPVEPNAIAKPDTLTAVARQEVPKPVEPKAIAKPDTVAVVARQEVPKPVEPIIRAKADTVAITASNTKPELPAATITEAKKPGKQAEEKTVLKEVPKEVKKETEPVLASSVKPAVPPVVQKDTSKPALITAAVTKPAPKKDTAVVAKTVAAKPPVVSKPEVKQPVAGTVAKQTTPTPNPVVQKPPVQPVASGAVAVIIPPKPAPAKPAETVPVVVKKAEVPKPVVVVTDPVAEQLYVSRKKINQGEIPIAGDSIELNFYDNAEVDGDSISVFLNGKLLFNHVMLNTTAYTYKIATEGLADGSELTMVAENLGTIPPNTALMLAFVEGQRYSARIESTEKTSGVIKLVKRQ